MSTNITKRSQIPDAPFYVLSNDAFMSHSPWCEGINTIILPCYNYEQAAQVEAHIKGWRTDQRNVRIVTCKPQLRHYTHEYSLFTRADSSFYPGGRVQRVTVSGDVITIKRETGTRAYRATLDRLFWVFDATAQWQERTSYDLLEFTPTLGRRIVSC